jgi:hypothetical protein
VLDTKSPKHLEMAQGHISLSLYNPEVDPAMKDALDVMKIANEVIDEVVDRLLHEAAEKILKED